MLRSLTALRLLWMKKVPVSGIIMFAIEVGLNTCYALVLNTDGSFIVTFKRPVSPGRITCTVSLLFKAFKISRCPADDLTLSWFKFWVRFMLY